MKKILWIAGLIVLVITMVIAQTGNWTARTGNGSARITALNTNGNVGIGTTSPSQRLQVSGGGVLIPNAQYYMGENSSGTDVNILRMDSNNDVQLTNGGAGATYVTNSTFGGYALYVQATTGYIGIHTSTPNYILHVKDSYGSGATAMGIASKNLLANSQIIFLDSTTTKFAVYKTSANDFSIYNYATTEHSFQIEGTTGDVGIGTQTISDIDSTLTVKGSLHTTKHAKIDSTLYSGLLNVTGTSTLTGAVTASNTMTVASLATISGQLQVNDAIVMIMDDTTKTMTLSASTTGDDVSEFTVMGRVQTSNATVTGIKTISHGLQTALAFSVKIFAKDINDSTSGAFYERVAVFRRGTGAPTLVGSIQSPITIESDATWDVTLAANTNNTAVDVKVTGAGGKTVSWHAIIRYYRISDPTE